MSSGLLSAFMMIKYHNAVSFTKFTINIIYSNWTFFT